MTAPARDPRWVLAHFLHRGERRSGGRLPESGLSALAVAEAAALGWVMRRPDGSLELTDTGAGELELRSLQIRRACPRAPGSVG